ncbi:MAG: nucleotidyltransferase domain-containing protein [Promethearchaeota archaeon]
MRKINKKLHQLLDSLKFIISKLEQTDINWCLVGSLSLYLQGVKIKPNDIDILTDKEGAYKLNKIFDEHEIQKVQFNKSNLFYSHYGKLNINGVIVEIMGDLRIFIDGEWTKNIRSRLNSKKIIFYKGLKIPVSPLQDQLKSYIGLNRTKDLKKVKMIKKTLKL